jgi:potassium efflux system protein
MNRPAPGPLGPSAAAGRSMRPVRLRKKPPLVGLATWSRVLGGLFLPGILLLLLAFATTIITTTGVTAATPESSPLLSRLLPRHALLVPPVQATLEPLLEVRRRIEEQRTRLEELANAVQIRPVEEWLAANPIARLSERLTALPEEAPERVLWQAAIEHERAGAVRIESALERAGLAQATGERLRRLDLRIGEMLAFTPPAATERGLSEIEAGIASLERRRAQIQLELEQKKQTLERLETQLRGQADSLEHLRRERLADLEALPIAMTEALSWPDALDAWEHARDRRADARLLTAQLDAETLLPRIETLRLEIPVLDIEGQWLSWQLQQANEELLARADEDLRSLRQSLRQFERLLPMLNGSSTRLQEVQELFTRIDEIAGTRTRVRELQVLREQYAGVTEELRTAREMIEQRLAIATVGDMLGRILQQENRRVRQVAELQMTLRELRREVSQNRLQDLGLQQNLRALRDAALLPGGELTEREFLRLRLSIHETHAQVRQQLTESIHQTEWHLSAAVREASELERLVKESLLWWPSHTPIGLEWARQLPLAVPALLDWGYWSHWPMVFPELLLRHSVAAVLALMLVTGLFLWGRETPQRLAELAKLTEHRFTDRISHTFSAIGWTMVRVTPIPLAFLLIALGLQGLPEMGRVVEILAEVFAMAALWWFIGHLFLLFSGRNGVGAVHLNWNPLLVRRLRRQLLWFFPAVFILMALVALFFGHPEDLVPEVFGRAGILLFALFSAGFAWRLLAPIPQAEWSAREERRRRLMRLVLILAAGLMILLSLAGYLYTAATLIGRMVNTLIVLALIWLGYSLAIRALVLNETRLHVRRAREQRLKSAVLESAGSAEGVVVEAPEPHLSVENINQQTRTLLRALAMILAVLGALWVWADILPALIWLDGITLWSRSIVVAETEILSRVSLQDFLLAIFLGVAFTKGARNLPGLVEILLSRSTLMDSAGRYTVTTLLRYIMAVVAVISVFSLLGLRWTELQWMVAALTLGLGFGMQEVVANFVSGIIMLFERPVRVGDTITIGEYSGTVARIRTRATTIIDWDNREVVIPNKMFITERLINWTLSDTITRVVIPVGVSFQSNVDEVMELLQTLGENCPLVCKEPAPTVFFLRFGNSSLDFELRVYVDQMKDRLVVTSALHQVIFREFCARGIKIAYPQMDLHVRDFAPMPTSHPTPPNPTPTLTPNPTSTLTPKPLNPISHPTPTSASP